MTAQWELLAELRGQMLDELHAEMRRWEAQAISVEDQRDALRKQLEAK